MQRQEIHSVKPRQLTELVGNWQVLILSKKFTIKQVAGTHTRCMQLSANSKIDTQPSGHVTARNHMKKVITIQQPWASLIIQGHKKIETRSWNTKYRGELLIHAGLSKPKPEIYHQLQGWTIPLGVPSYGTLPYGAIIGSVNLVNVFRTEDLTSPLCKQYTGLDRISNQEEAFGDYSTGRYGWLLSDPVMFDNPIPCKGQLGLWNCHLEDFHTPYNLPIYGIDGKVIQ